MLRVGRGDLMIMLRVRFKSYHAYGLRWRYEVAMGMACMHEQHEVGQWILAQNLNYMYMYGEKMCRQELCTTQLGMATFRSLNMQCYNVKVNTAVTMFLFLWPPTAL